jgi:hypothetical protein
LSTVTLEAAAGVALGAVIGEAENLRNVRLVLLARRTCVFTRRRSRSQRKGLRLVPGCALGLLCPSVPPLPFCFRTGCWGSAPLRPASP